MKEWYVESIKRIVEKKDYAEILASESRMLNLIPSEDAVSILKQLFNEADDSIGKSQPFYRSRIFDSLLSIRVFDKVEFLIQTLETSSSGWSYACCRELATFKDPRAIEKLCQVVRKSDDPDLRSSAVEALEVNGDASALDIDSEFFMLTPLWNSLPKPSLTFQRTLSPTQAFDQPPTTPPATTHATHPPTTPPDSPTNAPSPKPTATQSDSTPVRKQAKTQPRVDPFPQQISQRQHSDVLGNCPTPLRRFQELELGRFQEMQ
jgi:hypothetical protein